MTASWREGGAWPAGTPSAVSQRLPATAAPQPAQPSPLCNTHANLLLVGCLQAALGRDDWRLLDRPAGMWLVLTVNLKTEQNVTISRKEDGHIVAQIRWACWTAGLANVAACKRRSCTAGLSLPRALRPSCELTSICLPTYAVSPAHSWWRRDLRPVSWKFATGPLPADVPVERLNTQASPPDASCRLAMSRVQLVVS